MAEEVIYKKTYHRFFQRVWSGAKTCEIRKNMEPVKIGTQIILVETSEKTGEETGRRLSVEVTDIVTPNEMSDLFDIDDLTVMSIRVNSRRDDV